eukprot:SAG31_NODE_3621_length_4059_cov_7.360101_1_plen_89_part_00
MRRLIPGGLALPCPALPGASVAARFVGVIESLSSKLSFHTSIATGPLVRLGFVRKVYALLSVQLFITFGVIALFSLCCKAFCVDDTTI